MKVFLSIFALMLGMSVSAQNELVNPVPKTVMVMDGKMYTATPAEAKAEKSRIQKIYGDVVIYDFVDSLQNGVIVAVSKKYEVSFFYRGYTTNYIWEQVLVVDHVMDYDISEDGIIVKVNPPKSPPQVVWLKEISGEYLVERSESPEEYRQMWAEFYK